LPALVAACATTNLGSPHRTVRGCWIDRAEATTTTMRWLPDRDGLPPNLIGETRVYHQGDGVGGPRDRSRYRLELRGKGWVFCALDSPDARCWPVSGVPSGPLTPGRVAVQGSREHLHITLIADDTVEDIFVGRRDGCD
jgi:hypothetical protein